MVKGAETGGTRRMKKFYATAKTPGLQQIIPTKETTAYEISINGHVFFYCGSFKLGDFPTSSQAGHDWWRTARLNKEILYGRLCALILTFTKKDRDIFTQATRRRFFGTN